MSTNAPSNRPYMGATPYQDDNGSGVTFRVWAPFAHRVVVIGEFNQWAENMNPLYPEGHGYWSVDVPGASEGQQYLFKITASLHLPPRATILPAILHRPGTISSFMSCI